MPAQNKAKFRKVLLAFLITLAVLLNLLLTFVAVVNKTNPIDIPYIYRAVYSLITGGINLLAGWILFNSPLIRKYMSGDQETSPFVSFPYFFAILSMSWGGVLILLGGSKILIHDF